MALSTVLDTPALAGPRAHVALERFAAQALTAQDFVTAFKYADRRCRVEPPPAAHCFVLRAEANWKLASLRAGAHNLAIPAGVDEAGLVEAVVDWVGRS